MAHNWFLRSLNTFVKYPGTTFGISHLKMTILVSSIRKLIFHGNQQRSRFWWILRLKNCCQEGSRAIFKKFRGALKCFKMAHNWFLRSLNTFVECHRDYIWNIASQTENFDVIDEKADFSWKSRFWRIWTLKNGCQEGSTAIFKKL